MVTEITTLVLLGMLRSTFTVNLPSLSHQRRQRLLVMASLVVIAPLAPSTVSAASDSAIGRDRQLLSFAFPDDGHMPDLLHHCEQEAGSHLSWPKNDDEIAFNCMDPCGSPFRPAMVKKVPAGNPPSVWGVISTVISFEPHCVDELSRNSPLKSETSPCLQRSSSTCFLMATWPS